MLLSECNISNGYVRKGGGEGREKRERGCNCELSGMQLTTRSFKALLRMERNNAKVEQYRLEKNEQLFDGVKSMSL